MHQPYFGQPDQIGDDLFCRFGQPACRQNRSRFLASLFLLYRSQHLSLTCVGCFSIGMLKSAELRTRGSSGARGSHWVPDPQLY